MAGIPPPGANCAFSLRPLPQMPGIFSLRGGRHHAVGIGCAAVDARSGAHQIAPAPEPKSPKV